MPTVAEKRRVFRALHEEGCFVIPNPWDVGSALYLQSLGFKALATTSSGAAWSVGYADGALPLEATLTHLAAMVAATDVPVNADFMNGFADDTGGVADNVRRAVATGIAGVSIEDEIQGTGRLYDFGAAVERVAAARRAIDGTGEDVMLVARSEVFLTDHARPLDEALRRLKAFSDAGADCLYAPGVKTADDITALVKAVAPKPLNVLAGFGDFSLADYAGLGVRRISVGGALARSAWAGFMAAAQDIATHGRFVELKKAASGKVLNDIFSPGPRGHA